MGLQWNAGDSLGEPGIFTGHDPHYIVLTALLLAACAGNHPSRRLTGDARIAEIILRYKARFSQKAVLLVEEKPSIHFK